MFHANCVTSVIGNPSLAKEMAGRNTVSKDICQNRELVNENIDAYSFDCISHITAIVKRTFLLPKLLKASTHAAAAPGTVTL